MKILRLRNAIYPTNHRYNNASILDLKNYYFVLICPNHMAFISRRPAGVRVAVSCSGSSRCFGSRAFAGRPRRRAENSAQPVRCRRAGSGSQKSEVRGQKSEIRSQNGRGTHRRARSGIGSFDHRMHGMHGVGSFEPIEPIEPY